MRLPDEVEIIRPSGTDGYGNPGRSFENPTIIPEKGFELRLGEILFLAGTSAIREGDRLRLRGKTYEADVILLMRSPSRDVAYRVDLKEVEGL